ncbi:MAG: hypothetical protein PF569_03170 [Candidatus Woesearchaeota archaeon]|nr:hypothetical protein [Candidatus Woesearchaeota archaeon]
MGEITAINLKVPKETTLPDGNYSGTWGGYLIELRYEGKTYELTTKEGVRGMGIRVLVTIKDGVATFENMAN